MDWIIIGIFIIAVLAIFAFKSDYGKEKKTILETQKRIKQTEVLSESQRHYIGDKCISLYERKGYELSPIAGAYYQNLSISIVGKFNGYAVAETDNKYDPCAIAVYSNDRIHLGFLPKGNKKLHTYILKEGGTVHAYGYMGCDSGGAI